MDARTARLEQFSVVEYRIRCPVRQLCRHYADGRSNEHVAGIVFVVQYPQHTRSRGNGISRYGYPHALVPVFVRQQGCAHEGCGGMARGEPSTLTVGACAVNAEFQTIYHSGHHCRSHSIGCHHLPPVLAPSLHAAQAHGQLCGKRCEPQIIVHAGIKVWHTSAYPSAYGMVGRHHGKAHGRHGYGKTKRVVQAVHIELPGTYLHVHRRNHLGTVAPHYAHRVRLCRNICHAQQAAKNNHQRSHDGKVRAFDIKTLLI